ncbi:MAG: lysophospholipid acyltransferase family protein [Pirellulales bacterium]
MRPQRAVQYLVYLIVRILICVVQAMQIETCQSLAAGLAWLFARVLGVRRKVVAENLLHAFPEMSEAQRRRLARQMWEHLFLFVMEVAHAPRKIHETNWRQFVRLKNADIMVRALISGRATILVMAHHGNFELAGYIMGVLGFPTFTVARTLDNPFLDTYVNRFRTLTGQHMLPKKGGYEDIVATLAHGGAMTLLADQYAGSKGCWVEFFGRPASAHKAIALLTLDNDAPLTVSYCRRLERPLHYELCLYAVADPRDGGEEVGGVRPLTQWYTTRLEEIIRMAPEQYWWLHRRWKDNRPAKRRKHAA